MTVSDNRSLGVGCCKAGGSTARALVAAIIICALAGAACAQQPSGADSGVYGVVPYQAEDLDTVAGEIVRLRSELDDSKANLANVQQALAARESTLASMQNQCAQAFDPQSRLPMPYAWPGRLGAGECLDRRFPTGYMRLVSAAGCKRSGEFRLALPPGRYAVFVGDSPIYHAFEGGRTAKTNHWWQLVTVKRHRWIETDPPAHGAVNPPQPPRIEPRYDSGVRGRAGPPSQLCGSEAIEPSPPTQMQCVEAFPAGSGMLAACADCRLSDGAFELPLPPGRYTLDFFLAGQALDQPENHQLETVKLVPGRWVESYALGAHPGAVATPRCPPVL